MSGDDAYQKFYQECIVCHRRILVEVIQFGISHIAGLNAICADCVLESPMWNTFSKEHPKQAEEIKVWVNSKS